MSHKRQKVSIMFARSLVALLISTFLKYPVHAQPVANNSASPLLGDFVVDTAVGGNDSSVEKITIYAARLNFTIDDGMGSSRYGPNPDSLLDMERSKSSDFAAELTFAAGEKEEDGERETVVDVAEVSDNSTPLPNASHVNNTGAAVEATSSSTTDSMSQQLTSSTQLEGRKDHDLPPGLHTPSDSETPASRTEPCNKTLSSRPDRPQTLSNVSSDAYKRLSRSQLSLHQRRYRKPVRTHNQSRNVKSVLSRGNKSAEDWRFFGADDETHVTRDRRENPVSVSLRERGCLPVVSSPAVQDRATCPFRFITTFDRRRLPSLLVTVQCMCKGSPCSSRKGFRCVQISKPISMMRRLGRVYSEMLEEVPLACVCAYVGADVRDAPY